jgi:hypothetical protein
MCTRILPLAAGILLLAGCAGMESGGGSGTAVAQYPPPDMDHRVGTSHLELFWRCVRSEPGTLRLDGLVANFHHAQPIRFFEAELVGVDAGGRERSAARAAARDPAIYTAQFSPFLLSLTPQGDEARFDLYYNYQFQESDGIIVSAGRGFPVFAYYQRFLARDVCNPAQHRMRQ